MADNKLTNTKALEIAIATLSTIEGFNEEVLTKLGNIKGSYEKKSGPNKKPTKAQRENIKTGERVFNAMEVGKVYTLTDLIKLFDNEFTSQKLVSLLKPYVGTSVSKTEGDKGATQYTRVA